MPAPDPAPDPGPRRTPDQIAVDIALRLGMLGALVFMALSVLWPLLPILTWSVILSVALYPVFIWLRSRLGGRGWAASLLLTLLSLAVVFGPAAVLVSSLVVSLEHLAVGVSEGTLQLPPPPAALLDLPIVGKGLHDTWALAETNFPGFFQRYGHTLVVPGERLLEIVAGLAGAILVFAIAVIVAGVLLVPGARLVAQARKATVRVAGQRGSSLILLSIATVRSVARGVIGVAVLQTLVIGVGLIVAGVPHAGLLTLAVLALTIAQIGPIPVIAPLLVWFWMTREPGPAVIFTVYMIAAGVIENVLKPLVMRQGLEAPMPVILVGVFGGTVAYGLPGLFLGPMVLAVAYELSMHWARTKLEAPGSGDRTRRLDG